MTFEIKSKNLSDHMKKYWRFGTLKDAPEKLARDLGLLIYGMPEVVYYPDTSPPACTMSIRAGYATPTCNETITAMDVYYHLNSESKDTIRVSVSSGYFSVESLENKLKLILIEKSNKQ